MKQSYIFESKRLLLRNLSVEDAESFFLLNQDPLVLKYTGDLPFDSIAKARLFLLNYIKSNESNFQRLAVIEKSSKEFLGWCGINHDTLSNECDIGFRFFQHYWNKGFATEAALACLEYTNKTLHINNIIGRTHQENKASIAVLEKIGMRLVETRIIDNEPWLIYGISTNY